MPPWLPRVLPRTAPRHSATSFLYLGPHTPPTPAYRCSLCHTASRAQHPSPPPAHNTPKYTPLLREIEQRRDEARRSILVQVKGFPSAPDLGSYCQEVFGPVEGLHFHTNPSGNFKSFFVVEFADSESVEAVLRLAQHQESDGSSTPVPVYSPFLWLAGKPGLRGPTLPTLPTYRESKGVEKQGEDPDHQMFQLWQASLMSEVSTRVRYLLGRQIELAISGLFPRAQVLPFGSSVNGFGTSASDQDMFLVLDTPKEQEESSRLVFHAKGGATGERAQVQRHCEEISKIIQSFLPGCQDVQKILNARVPIIKYSHQFAGLECDLSMSSSSGLHMSRLLHLWAHIDWRVRPLVTAVRTWAKAQGLVKDFRPTAFFTNFTLTLLVVCYLQQSHGILPSLTTLAESAGPDDSFTCQDGIQGKFLNDVEGRKAEFNRYYVGGPSLAQLLHGFFIFYSDFAFDQKCLCPVSGTSKPKVRSWRHSSVMDIINPLETDLNLSYNINKQALAMFQQKSTRAATKMETSGMIEGKADLFALMQSVEPKKSKNTTNLRDQEMFQSFATSDLRGEPDKETRALPTDLFTEKNKEKKKYRSSEGMVKKTSPPPEPKLPEPVASAPKESSEAKSKMTSWGGVSPVSLKEEGTEAVFRARKSPPPEERANLQRPKLSDLFSHSQSSQEVRAPVNKKKKKANSKEEEQRLENLKAKYLRKEIKDNKQSPTKPPTLKL